ncbi:MAG: hypothetical protein NTV58_07650 [Deltaproteobacteria bacterium]|nr:hypothetical protein [Deltaproteobacteria bacterium]
MRQKALILILLVAVAIISISCTQRGRSRGDDRPEAYQPEEFHILGTIPDILLLDFNLTTDQASKIATLRDNLIQEIKALQEKINLERELQKSQYAAGQSSGKSINESPSANMQLIQGMMNDKRTQYMQTVFQMLTPEQKTMWKRTVRGSSDTTNRQMGSGLDDQRGLGGGKGGRQKPGM